MSRFINFCSILLILLSAVSLKADEILLEAENAILIGLSTSNSVTGYSGSGYVTGFDSAGDSLIFNFTGKDTIYELIIGYSTPDGVKGYYFSVNEQVETDIFPNNEGSFTERKAGKYKLQDGENSLVIMKGWGGFYVDYIKLVESTTTYLLKPPGILADELADASTRSLFGFLIDQYGKKVLSGQQDMSEVQQGESSTIAYVDSVTEKYPAIGIFDFINHSPVCIEYGVNPVNAVENWISWALGGGGIVSLSWHWIAPTDLIDEPGGKEWYKGFYTHATTFDLAEALADPTSLEYQLLLRDLDSIAVELAKFQEADIPVLWRPLHEASGGWFWWGAAGPEAFKELWRLMFNRYINHFGLHNLIWVYTHGPPDWYPGDEYVDIVSLDLYVDSSSSLSPQWEEVQSIFNGNKLVALSESVYPPDPEKVHVHNTWWSWFSIWSGEFIRGVNQDFLKKVYTHEDIITLDELPDWRNYSPKLNYNDFAQIGTYINPKICTNVTRISFILLHKTHVKVDLFNIVGRKVKEYDFGILNAGRNTLTLGLADLAPGIYLIKIRPRNIVLRQKLIILK